MHLLQVDKVQHFPFKGTTPVISCCTPKGIITAHFSPWQCKITSAWTGNGDRQLIFKIAFKCLVLYISSQVWYQEQILPMYYIVHYTEVSFALKVFTGAICFYMWRKGMCRQEMQGYWLKSLVICEWNSVWWASHDIEAVLDGAAKWKQIEIPAPHTSGPLTRCLSPETKGHRVLPFTSRPTFIMDAVSLSSPSHVRIPITPPYSDNLFSRRRELELLM